MTNGMFIRLVVGADFRKNDLFYEKGIADRWLFCSEKKVLLVSDEQAGKKITTAVDGHKQLLLLNIY
jgi:hypothetical protein